MDPADNLAPTPPAGDTPHPGMSFPHFVALIAALQAAGALSIDTMLPALPQIGRALHVTVENDRQWIVTAYLLGLGCATIVYGTLADRFGRRPVILAGLGISVAGGLLAAMATSFPLLIAARVIQGVGGAAARVLAVTIVRDNYSGRHMARVMSLSFIVFMAVPIIAPSIGQAIILVAPWRMIFVLLAAIAAVIALWTALRLRESLHEQDRTPISFDRTVHAFKIALTDRISIGYIAAMSLVSGALFGFINSAQQIFTSVFHDLAHFPLVFALIAGGMGVASLVNSKIVERVGTRRVSHSALLGFIAFSGLHALVAARGHETLVVFAVLQAATMFCFGLLGSNFSSMSMEPLGHLAGTGSSVQSFLTTLGGSLLGFAVGQHFNGTALPLIVGYLLLGLGALVVVLITEKGRLFQPTPAGEATAFAH